MGRLSASIILALCVTAIADSWVDPKLSASKTPVLGDHLRVALPVEMRLAPRRESIMSAENSAEDETRAMLDVESARFVMMAQELYALAGTDAKASIEAVYKTGDFKSALEPLALPKPLVGYATSPIVSSDRPANLVYAAWIANGDGTVQLLSFYVNPAGAAQGLKWAELGKRIVESLAPGSRMLARNAGARALGDLAMAVSDDWVVSAQPGPDFAVFHLRKLVVLGQKAPSCGVYIGDHPSSQHEQQNSDTTTTLVAGKVLGSRTEWSTWGSNGSWSTETMVKHPGGAGMVHVFCSAASESELAGLRAMAGSLHSK
jgi:hypothetical protein